MFVIDHERMSMMFALTNVRVVYREIFVMMTHYFMVIARVPNEFA